MKKEINDSFLKVVELIKEKSYLIWYVKDIDNLSKGAVVESILNWGGEDVQKMIEIVGIQEVKKFLTEISLS
jgi:hypothetical protein